jgi:BirA family biotin operon repressor/biotin-[acetyl-CoA-carboxylase] ligase
MFINSFIKNNIKSKNISYYVKNHVSSTNDYLNYEYIRDQAPIIILSNNQRHPRGRRGKKWVNFQGSSLGFSLCLKFNKSLREYKILSQLVGVSIIESCEILGNESLKIKWPNDIMQGDKKVCGTLIENLLSSEKSFYSMIGFGFNVCIPNDLINLLAGTTASILLDNIELFEKFGFSSLQKKWNQNMYAMDKNVILKNKDKEIFGKLIGINDSGELEIKTKEKIVKISDINYSMRILP